MFVLKKIRQGLKSEEVDEPMTDADRDRLLSGSSIQKNIPTSEWDNWSRRTHHALQVAFLDDTDNVSDADAIDEWRAKVVNVVDDAFQRVSFENEEPLVLEDAATHFVQNDLFRYLSRTGREIEYGEKEKRLARAFDIPISSGKSGCLSSVVLAVLAVLAVMGGAGLV